MPTCTFCSFVSNVEHEYYGAKSLKPDYRTMNFYSE